MKNDLNDAVRNYPKTQTILRRKARCDEIQTTKFAFEINCSAISKGNFSNVTETNRHRLHYLSPTPLKRAKESKDWEPASCGQYYVRRTIGIKNSVL